MSSVKLPPEALPTSTFQTSGVAPTAAVASDTPRVNAAPSMETTGSLALNTMVHGPSPVTVAPVSAASMAAADASNAIGPLVEPSTVRVNCRRSHCRR